MPKAVPDGEVTVLLQAWSEGDQKALERLAPVVYNELRRLARHYLSRERSDHSLQATALVNEAYLRLVDYKRMRWENRAHFFAVSAQLMRRILVDHAGTIVSAGEPACNACLWSKPRPSAAAGERTWSRWMIPSKPSPAVIREKQK